MASCGQEMSVLDLHEKIEDLWKERQPFTNVLGMPKEIFANYC